MMVSQFLPSPTCVWNQDISAENERDSIADDSSEAVFKGKGFKACVKSEVHQALKPLREGPLEGLPGP